MMKRVIFSPLCAVAFWAATLGAGASVSRVEAETTRLPAVRDLYVSSAAGEEEGNNGASPRLKVKGYQEFSLLDFDVSSLRGRRIRSAKIGVKLASEERLHQATVGSIVAPWNEGDGRSYDKTSGASSFRWRANPDVPWSDAASPSEYSDITSVTFGEGGSFWASAEASEPVDGWQTIPIDPRLVAARAAGLSTGFVFFDDVGTELVRGEDGEKVEIRLFPNRFFFSRDQNAASTPYLEVEFDEEVSANEKTPKPLGLAARTDALPLGDVEISWTAPRTGEIRLIGFEAKVDGASVPQSLIPAPKINGYAKSPECFVARLGALGLKPGKAKKFELVAVDELGNRSEPAALNFDVSDDKPCAWNDLIALKKSGGKKKSIKDDVWPLKKKMSPRPVLDDSQVSVLNEFDKATESGELIPKLPEDYKTSNAIWNARERRIDLAAARGEFVGFQLLFEGSERKVRAELRWAKSATTVKTASSAKNSTPETTFYRLARVETSRGKIGDPAIPLATSETDVKSGCDAIYCEIYVPKNAAPGERRGTLRLTSNGEKLDLTVRLNVWNFNIPNELSFLPEMNCYSLPANELEYYRLAQRHRTYVNRVPYSHRGTVGDGLAPKYDAATRSFDWSDWDRRFGSLFDGSAFADSPRGATPIEAFYLPFFENFPANIFEEYDETVRPVDAAFSDAYKASLQAALTDAAEHFVESGWSEPRFLFYLNNKMDYKRDGWSRASSPWLLDEPASFQDFTALRFFAEQLRSALEDVEVATKYNGARKAKNASSGARPILFRADISRPQWSRDSLDGLLDVNVVGGDVFRRYNRRVMERRDRFGELVYAYGTTAAPELNGWQPVAWSLDAWSLGADGIVPWQTIGNDESWKKSDELSLFYPATEESGGKVVASLRLKAYRRGQQDVEYLTALCRATGRPRQDVARALRERFPLEVRLTFRSADDAGTQDYPNFSPDEWEKLRREIGAFLSETASLKE
ncbi:MAG: DUF4091 domain-containing protein [Thermoguttaceae bacterium]|nr:DUF4091 domain-containing protein [Thermoguttaceae bacterium]